MPSEFLLGAKKILIARGVVNVFAVLRKKGTISEITNIIFNLPVIGLNSAILNSFVLMQNGKPSYNTSEWKVKCFRYTNA